MKEHLDEEYEAKMEIERQLSKAFADIQLWQTTYELKVLQEPRKLNATDQRLLAGLQKWEIPLHHYKKKLPTLKNQRLDQRLNQMI